MMTRICMSCKITLGVTEGPDDSITHGYCELCTLETLEKENLITPDEKKRLTTIRFNIEKQRANLSRWYSHKLAKQIYADRYSLFQSASRRVQELGEYTHRIVRDDREEYFWVVGHYDAQRLVAAGHTPVSL